MYGNPFTGCLGIKLLMKSIVMAMLSQFAEGFTFTSPAPDDHIPLDVYKQRCFPQSKYVKKIEFIAIVQDGDHYPEHRILYLQ